MPVSLVVVSVDCGNSKPYARLSLSPSDWVLRAVSFDLTPALKVWVIYTGHLRVTFIPVPASLKAGTLHEATSDSEGLGTELSW